MNAEFAPPSRREFLGTAGALMITWAALRGATAPAETRSGATGPDPSQLGSWLSLGADGQVEAAVGKIEAGLGVSTAFVQIVAEELDVPMKQVRLRMGDTATTVDQRGTGSSNGIVEGGGALRQAAAEARAVLLGWAAERLDCTAGELEVVAGRVRRRGTDEPGIGYGELVAGRHFTTELTGKVRPKDASQYRLVGTSVPRIDVPAKLRGEYAYVADLRLPGMVHARVLRPPAAGAHCLEVDDGAGLPGLLQVVRRGDFVAVVCEREEQAVAAARQLHVRWSAGEARFPASYEELYRRLGSDVPEATEARGDGAATAAALATAERRIAAEYRYPFQSHACMGPACAVADVRDGGATVWMGGQKPYPLRRAVARLLHLDPANVRVIWQPGTGSYGMNDADDAAIDAAWLSAATGRPVRVQYARSDATAWDPKGPPIVMRLAGALDAAGNVTAHRYEAFGYSGRLRASSTSDPEEALSVQLAEGARPKGTHRFQFPAESYRFAPRWLASHLLPWRQALGTVMRTAHLRDPDGLATCFASESFIDELAVAAGVDPVAFRLRYLSDDRERETVRAVAERAGWGPRERVRGPDASGWWRGRGVAYAPRNGTVVALVAEVKVRPDAGIVRVTRFVVAHDCGFIVNPKALEGTIEANLMHALSRTLHEAVQFTADTVTSVDWATYPVLDATEVPESVEIVHLNHRSGARSTGAGEPATRPVAAAVANAVFDATGCRLREVPFNPEKVRRAWEAGAVERAGRV